MAFNVSIQITAESKMEAAKQAEAQLKALAGAAKGAGDASGASAAGMAKSGDAAEKTKRSVQGLPTALTLVTHELGVLGPAGSVAAQGINSLLTTGFGPVGLAVTAFGVAVGVVSNLLSKMDEEAKKTAEGIKAFNDAIAASKSIQSDIRLSVKADLATTDVDRAAVQNERSRQQLVESFGKLLTDEKFTAEQQAAIRAQRNQRLAELDAAAAVKTTQARIRDAEGIAKERQGLIDQVGSLITQRQAIGASADEMIKLNTATQLNAIANSEAARKHADITASLIEETRALGNLQRAQLRIESGRPGLEAAQQQFGVRVPGFDTANQLRTGTQFFGLTRELDEAKAPFEQKINALATFAQQALQQGIPDISGLLFRSGFDTRQVNSLLSGLKQQFGDDFYNQVVKTSEGFKGFWQSAETQITKANQAAGAFGTEIVNLDTKLASLQKSVAQQMAMNMDVSQPKTAIQEIKTMLDGIPLTSYRTVIVEMKASGSPVMDFSSYVGSYMPGLINDISKLSPEVMVNVPDFTKRMREAADIQAQITRLSIETPSFDPLGKQNSLYRREAIDSLSAQLQDLRFGLARDVSSAQPRTNAGGSGGGGGTVNNITLDLRGANINKEILDSELLPRIEQLLLATTGREPVWRVLS